jgi:hypothetical protein
VSLLRMITFCTVAMLSTSTAQSGQSDSIGGAPDSDKSNAAGSVQSIPGGQTGVSGALLDPTGSLTNDAPVREPIVRGASEGMNTVPPTASDAAIGRIAPSRPAR